MDAFILNIGVALRSNCNEARAGRCNRLHQHDRTRRRQRATLTMARSMPSRRPGSEDDDSGSSDDPEGTLAEMRKALTEQFNREKELSDFDGYKLRNVLQEKWGRSYDIQITSTRWLNGSNIVTLNIMWKYLEQQSFPLCEYDYLCHLEMIAQYLLKWNAVNHFISFVSQVKGRPRVAKAVSVPIDITQEALDELKRDMKRI